MSEKPTTGSACPHCGKAIVIRNARIHDPKSPTIHKSTLGIVKTRLVFFDDDGKLLVKCRGCGHLARIPFQIKEEKRLTG
jgi:DNA-directed RNA polymerase subunit RPC12/RpoP